jgi:hypothetical protein
MQGPSAGFGGQAGWPPPKPASFVLGLYSSLFHSSIISRVGQNHIYTVYIQYFLQGFHQIYGHIRCIYTVLANPNYKYNIMMLGRKFRVAGGHAPQNGWPCKLVQSTGFPYRTGTVPYFHFDRIIRFWTVPYRNRTVYTV